MNRNQKFEQKGILIRQNILEADIHPFVKGITFETAWKNRISAKFGETRANVPCLDDMIKMKKAAGRITDLEDLKYLREIKKKKGIKKKSAN